jgi:FdhD protein
VIGGPPGRFTRVTDTAIRRPTTRVRVRALDAGRVIERPDKLVTEEPMEIRVHGPGQRPEALAVTMRTPGADFELAVGFCVTERILGSAEDLAGVAYCVEDGEQRFNVVTVRTLGPVDLDVHRRNFMANASCGLCGKAALDQVAIECAPVPVDGMRVRASTILRMPDRLRDAQRVFDMTGGLHAAALFDADGELQVVREDVGRHNALDKLVGRAAIDDRLPLAETVLLVSGRVSFEIVQKAARAGVPMICAVSAPSSLAVDAGAELGMTVIGFVRGGGFNVYSHPERVALDA